MVEPSSRGRCPVSDADHEHFESVLNAVGIAAVGNRTQRFFGDAYRWRIRIQPAGSPFARWLIWRDLAERDQDTDAVWLPIVAADGNAVAWQLVLSVSGLTETMAKQVIEDDDE